MAQFHLNPPVPTTVAQASASLAQAHNVHELVACLPSTYRPSFAPLLEDLFKRGQRAAQALGGLKALEKHANTDTLPSHLRHLKPVTLQVLKEFHGNSILEEAQKEILESHTQHIQLTLKKEIVVQRGVYHLLISQASPLQYTQKVLQLCEAVDADLLAHMYYSAVPAVDEERETTTHPDTPNDPTTKRPHLGDAMDGVVIGEPTKLTDGQKRTLLGNLELSGERIAATLATNWCARAVALGRASTEHTLAEKLKKVGIRDEAKKVASAARPSTTPPTKTSEPDSATAKRLSSLEKTLQSLVARLPKGNNTPSLNKEAVTNLVRKRPSTREGHQEELSERSSKRRCPEGQRWEEAGSPEEGEREREQEMKGLNTLRRCNYFVNGDNVPSAVLNVPFASVVAYMKEKMPPCEHVIMPTPVFISPGVIHVPEEIERIVSFNLKFIPHCDPNPEKVLKGFEEFKRACRNRLFFAEHEKDPQLLPVILKKLYQPSGWQPDEEDRHPGLEWALNRVGTYLRETIAASTKNYKRPLNSAFSAVKEWMIKNSCLVKMTDKNLGASIISIEWYRNEVSKLLNTDTYSVVDGEDFELWTPYRAMQTKLRRL